jgi:hypothetical protein
MASPLFLGPGHVVLSLRRLRSIDLSATANGDSTLGDGDHFDDYERRAVFDGFAEDDVSEVVPSQFR